MSEGRTLGQLAFDSLPPREGASVVVLKSRSSRPWAVLLITGEHGMRRSSGEG